MRLKSIILPVFAGLITLGVQAQPLTKKAFFETTPAQRRWVDSVYSKLNREQKIGQLFMVAAFSNKDAKHVQQIAELVETYQIGGLCFFAGGPLRQAHLTNYYQSLAKVPLMISIDGEWGLAMRLDSTMRFPRQMTLAAIKDESLIYHMGAAIARQCKRIGIHMNLAPVVDINSNPLNPVIANRSFGERKTGVSRKSYLYMQGMQENGVLACAKHFPGHGDTDADSHFSLPVIKHSITTIDTLDLYPFRELIRQGVAGVMVAHLSIPALDTTKNLATTLSKKVVDTLLQKKMGFRGLVFTDALNMKGVSSYYAPGEVDLRAFIAGNDILLYAENVPLAIAKIKAELDSNRVDSMVLEMKVKKILAAKYWAGLNHYRPVLTKNLYQDLNTPEDQYLNQRLYETAITLLQNKAELIPLKDLTRSRMASLVIGDKKEVAYARMLNNYAPVALFELNASSSPYTLDSVFRELQKFQVVNISIHNTNVNAAKNYGVNDVMVNAISRLQGKSKLIVTVFGNPYVLSKLPGIEKADAVILAYEGTELMQNMTAQVVYGGASASGQLAVTASSNYKRGTGSISAPVFRLRYTQPEELGLASSKLVVIDTIVQRAIRAGAMPGCQVLVARRGDVIYNKAFGHHTYDKERAVKTDDIYDLASVTKIAGTTLALMDLYDKGKLKLDEKLSKLSPTFKKTNVKSVKLNALLTHQAGLPAFKPFWKETMEGDSLSPELYVHGEDESHKFRVFSDVYIRNDYPSKIFDEIVNSDLKGEGKYLYSDFSMIIGKRVFEDIANKDIESFLHEKYYDPMGLSTMGYLPRKRFSIDLIPPTEVDKQFRKALIWGDVHDPTAAMFGGVSGHAGLFSNANDLAILMQMLLQKGEYGGKRYLKAETVKEFTRQQFPKGKNRRGLGFDKPEPDSDKPSPVSKECSLETFGHTGFTGTCVWVDPQEQLIFIFLSNRVHPDAENTKLVKMNVRTDIQDAIYKAIKN